MAAASADAAGHLEDAAGHLEDGAGGEELAVVIEDGGAIDGQDLLAQAAIEGVERPAVDGPLQQARLG
jgi:hypothetical protein